MARNRKRAKERRARRPQPVASARVQSEEASSSPIEHAAPDVELAEAQLALGRAELDEKERPDATVQELQPESEADEEELELEAEESASAAERDGERTAGGELEVAPSAAAEARPRTGSRLVNFIRGSWRELQRVQWPDRRQVIQATGVVIGFVIVAGVFLGVSDFLAGKLMDYILK